MLLINRTHDIVSAYGYSATNYGENCTAWDKAMYACTVDPQLAYKHDYVVWIEQDVFIPSIQALHTFTQSIMNYRDPRDSSLTADFVSAHRKSMFDGWWWAKKYIFKHPIWPIVQNSSSHALISMVAMSRNYLQLAHKFHTTVYPVTGLLQEFIYPTIATYYNVTWYLQPQLAPHIIFRHKNKTDSENDKISFHYTEMMTHDINKFYHPMKDYALRTVIRHDMLQRHGLVDTCPQVQ